MTDKWADFLISKVGYDTDHTHIVKVETRVDKGEKVGPPYEETRQTVISNLKKEKTYCTIRKVEKDWKKGEMVGIVTVNETEYIKTDKNEIEADNLGKLPEF